MTQQLSLIDEIALQQRVEAYNVKKQAKIERYNNLAEKAKVNSTQLWNQSREISSFIPPGQPILVGHHSEGKHRRDLNHIDNLTRKSIEEDKKADYYVNKANSAENNNAISSDDPESVIKLKEKLNKLQRIQDTMKKFNSEYRKCKGDVDKMNVSEEAKDSMKEAKSTYMSNFENFKPFEHWQLSNNNQNMNRIKKRIKKLEIMQSHKTKELIINGVKVVDNVEENRLQIFFDCIPEEDIRKKLKSSGFRFSKRNGDCWQAFRSNTANYNAKEILNNL